MPTELSYATWVVICLGVIQGALLPPVWRLTFVRTMRSASPELNDWRSVLLLFIAIVAIAIVSGGILLGPLYILNLIPLRDATPAWNYSWVSSMVLVFAVYYGVRKFRLSRSLNEENRRA